LSLLPLTLPPGVVRPGTVYDARNRYYDSNLVRWVDKVLQPWGGWSVLSNVGAANTDGIVRGMHAWKTDAGTIYVAIGTQTKL
jgi:hypothetical protein